MSKNYGRSGLLAAAAEGRVDDIEQLLDEGLDIDKKDPRDGSTPVILAAERGHVTAVNLLLDRGASFTKCKIDKWTVLHIASYNGQELVIAALIARPDLELDLNAGDCEKSTALHLASLYGYAGVIRRLLDAGADAGRRDCHDRLPMHLACRDGHAQVVEQLLQPNKSNVVDYGRQQDTKTGATPMHYAAQRGHAKIVRLLLEVNAFDATAKDKDGFIPAERAAQAGQRKALCCLLHGGACAHNAGSMFRLAAAFGHVDCAAEVLLWGSGDVAAVCIKLPQTGAGIRQMLAMPKDELAEALGKALRPRSQEQVVDGSV